MPASSLSQSKRSASGRGTTCKATRTNGERCRAIAGSGGLCTAHRDPARMVELGRKGGRGREASATGVRAAMELNDDELRSMARRTLEEMLRSGSEQVRARVA